MPRARSRFSQASKSCSAGLPSSVRRPPHLGERLEHQEVGALEPALLDGEVAGDAQHALELGERARALDHHRAVQDATAGHARVADGVAGGALDQARAALQAKGVQARLHGPAGAAVAGAGGQLARLPTVHRGHVAEAIAVRADGFRRWLRDLFAFFRLFGLFQPDPRVGHRPRALALGLAWSLGAGEVRHLGTLAPRRVFWRSA